MWPFDREDRRQKRITELVTLWTTEVKERMQDEVAKLDAVNPTKTSAQAFAQGILDSVDSRMVELIVTESLKAQHRRVPARPKQPIEVKAK